MLHLFEIICEYTFFIFLHTFSYRFLLSVAFFCFTHTKLISSGLLKKISLFADVVGYITQIIFAFLAYR